MSAQPPLITPHRSDGRRRIALAIALAGRKRPGQVAQQVALRQRRRRVAAGNRTQRKPAEALTERHPKRHQAHQAEAVVSGDVIRSGT